MNISDVDVYLLAISAGVIYLCVLATIGIIIKLYQLHKEGKL